MLTSLGWIDKISWIGSGLELFAQSVAYRADPGLCTHLHGIPWAAERRRVAEIEIIQIFDAHAVEKRRCEYIDAFRHLRPPVAEDLRAQESVGPAIARHPDAQFLCAGVIGLVIPGFGLDSDGIKSRSARFGFAQARPRDRQFEDLHGLGADRTREEALPANRVLAGYTPLLVCGRAERQIRRSLQYPMPGLDTVAGGPDARYPCLHTLGDANRARWAKWNPRSGGKIGVWSRTSGNQHQIGRGRKPARTRYCEAVRAISFDSFHSAAAHDAHAMP